MTPQMHTCGWHVMQPSLNRLRHGLLRQTKVGKSPLVVAHLASRQHVLLRRLSTWPCQPAINIIIIIIIIIIVVVVVVVINIIIIIIIIIYY